MLGLYVSDHPLFGIEHILSAHADTPIASLLGEDAKPDGTPVTVAGLITSLQLKRTKKGDLWAIATVEDLDGTLGALAAKGIEPEKPPYRVREGGSRICFVRDPDGYRVELIETTEG